MSTNEAGHWEGELCVSGERCGIAQDEVALIDDNDAIICGVWPMSNCDIDEEDDDIEANAVANATLIAMRVNTHAGLVAACLRVLNSTHFGIDNARNRTREALDIRKQLETALAKVTP